MTAPSNPVIGSTFGLTVNVGTQAYVGSAVWVEPVSIPAGVTPLYIETTRLDGITMRFPSAREGLTLGNVVPQLSRSATWYIRADTTGPQTFLMRAWSENGGEITLTKTVQVGTLLSDLMPTTMTLNPPAPLRVPGGSFSVTDTVQNVGVGPSGSSTTRYYLSLDAVKSSGRHAPRREPLGAESGSGRHAFRDSSR